MPRAHAAESGKIFLKEAVSDINTDRIGSFLTSLEVERGSCDPQCKAGGDAYLARFLISEHPEYMDTLQLVVTLPFKSARGWHLSNISKSPKSRASWRVSTAARLLERDYALFSLMFNTDARVQEILNLRICDLRLVSPCPAEQRGFLNDRGTPLTRFGVRYLLRKHVDMAAGEGTTLAEKSIHHRSLRHTTAIHLVKAGVDIATISQWLATRG